MKATGQSRTDDLRFTKASLYQLSYGGIRKAALQSNGRFTAFHERNSSDAEPVEQDLESRSFEDS